MPKLIGHRGLPQRFPENTLLSLEKALEAGADAVECDVQISREGVPYLFHDASLDRVAGGSGLFSELNSHDLKQLSVHEPIRFGDKFNPIFLSKLSEICELLTKYKQARIFVEIKPESFSYSSREAVLSAVFQAVLPIFDQVIIISFDAEILEKARNVHKFSVGWVLSEYNDQQKLLAEELEPEYVFCDVKKISGKTLWQATWSWAIYDIVSTEQARSLQQQGVEWIESWDVQTLRRGLSLAKNNPQ